MDILTFVTLSVTGFASCAEFGSYALVHPVIRKLPREHHIQVEQGLLRTFGRIMPALMTLCVVLSVSRIAVGRSVNSLHWCSAASFSLALISTIIFNVPINRATEQWDSRDPPSNGRRSVTGGNCSKVFGHGCF
jgi:hypothetical protein